jgi:hypothetical protein
MTSIVPMQKRMRGTANATLFERGFVELCFEAILDFESIPEFDGDNIRFLIGFQKIAEHDLSVLLI